MQLSEKVLTPVLEGLAITGDIYLHVKQSYPSWLRKCQFSVVCVGWDDVDVPVWWVDLGQQLSTFQPLAHILLQQSERKNGNSKSKKKLVD